MFHGGYTFIVHKVMGTPSWRDLGGMGMVWGGPWLRGLGGLSVARSGVFWVPFMWRCFMPEGSCLPLVRARFLCSQVFQNWLGWPSVSKERRS